jgi:AI-2 transport protein TqsA
METHPTIETPPQQAPPSQVQREQRIQTVCLLILSATAIACALWWLRPVMIPFVLAMFVAFGLMPLIDFMRQVLRIPRPVAVLITLVIGFVLLSVLGALVSASVRELKANASIYQTQIDILLKRGTLLLNQYGVTWPSTLGSLSDIPMKTVGSMLVGTTNAILDLLSKGLLVMLFLIFLLIGDTGRARGSGGVLGKAETRIKRYIIAKVILSAATGVLVWFVLTVLGVDLALVFGLFAFLLNFIPSVGSIIATLLPLPVVLVNPENTLTTIVLVIVLPATIQFVIGSLIEPNIMGGSLDLHPITIMLALIIWGMLWGVVGMLLATPLTAVMKIIFERMEPTKPMAELLAGRLDALRVD